MTDLRKQVIKLAQTNPELRVHLVPLLRQAMEFATPEALKKYLRDHPDADKSKHHVKKPSGGGSPTKPSHEEASKDLDKAMKGIPTNAGLGWTLEGIREKLADGKLPSTKTLLSAIAGGKNYAAKYPNQNWGGAVKVLEKLLDSGLVKD